MLKVSPKQIRDAFVHLPTIFYVMIIVLVGRIFFYISLIPYNIYTDSSSYIDFPFKDMLSFRFTSGRTPIYPLIIRICRFIAGEGYYLNLVVIVQAIVSFISVLYFYKACCLITSKLKIVYLVTILYGLTPSIVGWDNNILTESLALSGTVFFIYFILSYIKKPCLKFGLANIILIFVLTFLRPTFLLFDFLLFGFWTVRLLFNREERKLLTNLILCSMGVFVFILGYSYIFQQTHQIFSISDPIPRQNLIVCIERGYYKSSSNKKFINMIDEGLQKNNNESWQAMLFVLREFGNKQVMDLTKECISKNKTLYIKDLIKIATNISDQTFPGYYKSRSSTTGLKFLFCSFIKVFESIFSIFKGAHAYLVGVIELIICIFLWRKQKSPPWIHIGIFSFVTLIVITTFIGTCAEYPRTMICVLPFMYLSLTLFLNWLIKICIQEGKASRCIVR